MALFSYEAINTTGKTQTGTFTAELSHEVERMLLDKGLSPISIRMVAEKAGPEHERYETKISLFDKISGVKLEDRILFCRQIATMLDAGVPVLQSLKILRQQITNPVLKQIIADVATNVEQGASLSDSFAQFPKVFGQLFQNVIRIGEESGNLDNSFSYLALLYENEKDVKERIKSATRYPKIVISALFVAVFFLMSFVVPKFISLFEKGKVELPLPTKILILVSNFFAHHYLAIFIGIVVLIASYHVAIRYEEIVLFRDKMLLRTPIFSDLYTKIYMSRFCRVFAVLTKSGIDIIKTLRLSASALDNLILFRMIEQVTGEVEEGANLHSSMDKHPRLPAMVVQMVAVGEESGQLDAMMDKVADYYEVETDYTIKNLSTLIEPILLLFMGIMVCFIALAIFLPMWNMMTVMRG